MEVRAGGCKQNSQDTDRREAFDDLNGDGLVNVEDLSYLLGLFGVASGDIDLNGTLDEVDEWLFLFYGGDLDGDGDVDLDDYDLAFA